MPFHVNEISNAMGIWSVVAEIHSSDGTLFLAERYANGPDIYLTYVVAFLPLVHSDEYATEWQAGRYFDSPSTRANRQAARTHFLARAHDSLWS
jgi:hypothetical protein